MALAPACRRLPRRETAATAEQAVLDRRIQGLQGLVAAAGKGPLVPFGSVLATVDEATVQDLLRAGLPFERLVAERFRVRVERAEVHFEDGFGLVQLDGRATLADAPGAAAADVSVFGALDVVELDPLSGLLHGRVKVIAVDARRVGVFGVGTKSGERLVEDLGRAQLDEFSALASRLEIPIRLERRVSLPAMDAVPGIRIAAAAVPLHAGVVDVKAFRRRLWVCLDVGVEAPPEGGPR